MSNNYVPRAATSRLVLIGVLKPTEVTKSYTLSPQTSAPDLHKRCWEHPQIWAVRARLLLWNCEVRFVLIAFYVYYRYITDADLIFCNLGCSFGTQGTYQLFLTAP
jgi:hypothetical protein